MEPVCGDWRSIRNLQPSLSFKLNFNVRDGRKILYWEDNWLGIGCLKSLFPDIIALNKQQGATEKGIMGNSGMELNHQKTTLG